jgi:KaiC/GvpD/RAD55 family RecA-like ATPase
MRFSESNGELMDCSFKDMEGGRTPTGILGLDVQLGGGVPPGTTILIFAQPGSSAELFAQQFVYGGLLEGEEVYYFSTEHPIDEVIRDMKNFNWDVEEDLKKGRLEFIDAYSLRFYNILPRHLATDISAKEFLKKNIDAMNLLKSIVSEPRIKTYRGVIDSISFFLRSYLLNDVIETIQIVSSIGKTTNAVQLVMMTAGVHDPIVENSMRDICDGVIEFRMKEKGSEVERSILIRKMRGMIPPNRTISYTITHKGIELETTTRVL